MNDDVNQERLQGLIGEDYRLQWIIGHGGMSTVWLADDIRNDREVAIKVLKPEFSNAPEFLERFRMEADNAERIDCDNVVRVFDYREVPDPAGTVFCFIVMEYVRGETLADLLARAHKLSEAMTLDVLEQAAHGLAVIHRMDLVHRDIKPGNLLVTQSGQVKITDFGIAKAAAAVPLTRTGMVVGTAQYVSPEQAQGQDVTPASDVYSLGVVGHEMLSGTRPFSGDSSVSVVLAHINQAPPQLSTSVSAQTRELIAITLRKDPATRFVDGDELAQAISRVRLGHRPPQPRSAALAGQAVEPSPTEATAMLGKVAHPTTVRPAAVQQPQGPTYKQPKKSPIPLILGLLVVLLVLLAAGAVWLLRSGTFDGLGDETTSTTPEVVTEFVTPTESVEETTTIINPRPQQPTRQQQDQQETQQPTHQQQTEQPTTQQEQPAPTQVLPVEPTQPEQQDNNTGESTGAAGTHGNSTGSDTANEASAPEGVTTYDRDF